MLIRWFALAISIIYIRYCFLRCRGQGAGLARTVYFSRGTFTRDIHAMKSSQDVLLNANTLRRLFRLVVAPHRLQQIICFYYAQQLRADFAPVISAFYDECEKYEVSNICFGGIDYFEAAIFESRSSERGIDSVALFHENYTIPLVYRQTENIVSSYPEVPRFSRVYAIGPPAMEVLKRIYSDVRPHPLSRFSYSIDCPEFERDMLLIPFADFAYFATVAFSITYAFLIDLNKRESASISVKHKNSIELRRFVRVFGREAGMLHVTNPGASVLCASSRVVVCFNSLVYFEALAHGHMIAIPSFAEAKLGEIYTQHSLLPEADKAGIRTFSSFDELECILRDARALIPSDRLRWAGARRALLAESFF